RARTVPVARIAVNGSRRHAARTLQEHAGLSASEGWDCRQWSGPAKRLGRGRHVAEGWHHLVQLEWQYRFAQLCRDAGAIARRPTQTLLFGAMQERAQVHTLN